MLSFKEFFTLVLKKEGRIMTATKICKHISFPILMDDIAIMLSFSLSLVLSVVHQCYPVV